jgi:hypothetical protein
VSEQLRRAGVNMRRGGPPAHPASTQQILKLRDQGLTWPEIAEQVDMTVSGAWSRYRKAGHPSRHAWAAGSRAELTAARRQVLADALDQNLAIGVRAAVAEDGKTVGRSADHLGRAPSSAQVPSCAGGRRGC